MLFIMTIKISHNLFVTPFTILIVDEEANDFYY